MNTPNKLGITAAMLGATLLFSACTKEEQEELKLEAELLLTYSTLEFTVDSGIPAGDLELALSFDGEALGRLLTDNGYSMDQLKEFRFNKADFAILAPDGQTYDPIQNLSIELGLDNGTPVSIAHLDPIPDGLDAITLDVGDVNVADIVRHADARLIVKGMISDAISVGTLHKLDLGGKVVVQL